MSKPKSGFWKANQGFATTYEGEPLFVQKGELVRHGHPLLKGRDELFEPADRVSRFDEVDDGVEQATAAPGEKRGRRSKPKPEPEPEKSDTKTVPFGLTTSSLNRPPRSEAD